METKVILAIETSCDETAMCIIDTNNNVLAHVVNSQANDFASLGGVVPELASRKHVDNIFYVFQEVLYQAQKSIEEIDYIAVTYGPGLIGSLLVGVNFANSLSLLYNKPIIPVNHMQGHIYAISMDHEITYPHLSLIVSGGHTDLVYLQQPNSFELLGQTQDDACGECFDKVAKLLDLPYPGGPYIEQLAQTGSIGSYQLPIPKQDDSYDFSFSGLKAACYNLVNQAQMKHEVIVRSNFCASFQYVAITSLLNKLSLAKNNLQPASISIVGGVSCNQYLRQEAKRIDENIIFPDKALTTDNAMMIGLVATMQLNLGIAPITNIVNATPSIDVEEQWHN